MRRHRTDLPIEEFAPPIVDAIATTGSLVLMAEPGAGKSSVVPLLAAEARSRGQGPDRVVVLEPRRLAARATASRLAQLIDVDREDERALGATIGLTMRGEHRVSAETSIEVMTEAVLTARLQRDPELAEVGAIVFDEFHERNLHSDLGLAMALEARATIRPDLALVVMSATLDPAPVSALLGAATVIDVPGRTHPVETVHLDRPTPGAWPEAVAGAVTRALTETDGDVLVFVPGRREIDQVSRRLTGVGAELIPLHGGSDAAVQRRALAAPDQEAGSRDRRVIVATAVAETSVTVPGITAVVDGGLARRARFDPASGLGRLETRNVSRFAADQRRGRAGRLGPGRCYRLWSSEEHRLLDEAARPEIADGDPLPVAFELARWGDPDGADLPLLDHPGPRRLADARRILTDLGLTEAEGPLTDRGRSAATLGVHPRLGALLLTADDHDLLNVGSAAAAVLDDDRWPTTDDLGAEVERRRSELRRPAERLRARLGRRPVPSRHRSASEASGPPTDLEGLLARAWPDRVAAARPGRADRYLLAGGREVFLAAGSALAGAEFLVVAEADGRADGARIRRAVAIDRVRLRAALDDRVDWHHEVVWDDRDDRIRAERQQRLGAIVLHREPLSDPSPELVQAALATGLARRGLDVLRWTDRARSLRARLAWLHETDPDRWPAVDDQALLDGIDRWLDLGQCRTPADLGRLDVGRALPGLLTWEQRAALDELAPTAIDLPSGRAELGYETGRPVLSVKLQRLYGLDAHPTVGPHRTPVTIELLSPAGRPAQVTTDLPRFWRGSYAEVRRDLRGRYPKHRWPERPWEPDAGS